MSLNVVAELSAPNEAYTFTYENKYVRVDENKIKHDIVDAWRNFCAAQFCKEANDQSCIIDGIPYGPTPTTKFRHHSAVCDQRGIFGRGG